MALSKGRRVTAGQFFVGKLPLSPYVWNILQPVPEPDFAVAIARRKSRARNATRAFETASGDQISAPLELALAAPT